ncbi:MAG TPA: hypothetical protein VMQ10_15155 [Spirochaetia bacterium]|nr:hypothetical protein [Spirochaetia bacterium]
MVTRVARIVAAAALVLPLTTCVFFLSPFPGTLSQVVAKADVSALIPAADADSYQPCVLTPTGGDYVVLVKQYSSADPCALVFDSSLNFIQSYTHSQLGISGGGAFAMTDASGNAAMGGAAFTASDLAQGAGASASSPLVQLSAPGFSSPNALKNDVNFPLNGSTITYQQFSSWISADSPPHTAQVDAAGNSYQVVGVYNVDDTPAAGAVVLVLSQQNNSSNVTFVRIPLYDLTASITNSLKSPLLSNYTWKNYDNVPASSIGFAGDCMVGYSESNRALNRYSLSNFEVIQSLPIGNSDYHLQYAYKPTGGYSVVYDPTARTLTKVANWW